MLFLWQRNDRNWILSAKTRAHGKALTSLSTIGNIVVSGSSDSSVKVWEVCASGDSEELKEKQTISTGKRYPLSLALAFLPRTQVLLLAVSGTDTKVQLYLCREDQFIVSASLAGHEDWVRALSFRTPPTPEEPLILASGSQDATIRLWNIEPIKFTTPDRGENEQGQLSDELLDAFEASLGEVAEGEEGGRQISLKRHILTAKASDGSNSPLPLMRYLLVTNSALLHSRGGRIQCQTLSRQFFLLRRTRLSFFGRHRQSLGQPRTARRPFGLIDSDSVMLGAKGWVGSLVLSGLEEGKKLWRGVGQAAGDAGHAKLWGDASAEEVWQELGAISGHRGPVKGLSWSPNGEYLISAGVDQTTRIFGEIYHSDEAKRAWHEIARPQVHGYDLLDTVFLDPLKFVSIADEKVARVFEAPRNFVQLAKTLDVAYFSESEVNRPAGASVPPLGLSNKAVGDGSSVAPVLAPSTRQPFEGELSGATLWPEIEKIFGHGYESITIGVSHSRKFIATACKATSPEHAVVRIYETSTFKPFGEPLAGHALTVTRVAFSPDDKFVLSVSRDRTWHLFELKDNQGYVPVAADKPHARIIWDCAWSAEGDVFATASRDKLFCGQVKIWTQGDKKWTTMATIKTPSPATAVDFSPVNSNQGRRLAVGLEDGRLQIFSNVLSDLSSWSLDTTIDTGLAHVNQIHRLSWRPAAKDGKDGKGVTELASCSEDGTLKVLIIQG
ncbi:hypothetical protein NP233_g3066 [Leucocoprinus birnbaumii]|uniref:Elongator complex protein 2 n=1 Tax=Leucocoprinus birnbaumii TaxID=56174 RepID=A0AAD5VX50_9AGAR|nr:hypothetical protein NP233_g3066 [Leucocoprinus birnbaumii]